MIAGERVLRALTIQLTDLSKWTRLCNRIASQVAAAHPAYPRLNGMQLLSHVKRMLPEIRAMIDTIEEEPDEPASR